MKSALLHIVFPAFNIPDLTDVDICDLAVLDPIRCPFGRNGLLKVIVHEKSFIIEMDLIWLDTFNLIQVISANMLVFLSLLSMAFIPLMFS